MTAIPLLDVRDLTVEFQTRRGVVSENDQIFHGANPLLYGGYHTSRDIPKICG